jgi:hypothetical protein
MFSGEAPLVLSLSHDVKLGTVSYIACTYVTVIFIFGTIRVRDLPTYNIPTEHNESATLIEVAETWDYFN